MALLGTGSMSAYVVQHAELPVAVVRQDLQLLGALQAPVRFCIWPRRGGFSPREQGDMWSQMLIIVT